MKPVFGNVKENRNIEDATTISRIEKGVEKENIETGQSQSSFKTRQDDSHLNMITREEAEKLAEQAASRAVETTLAKRKEKEEEEGDGSPVISSKTVKELQSIAGVFNALKEFSANPLQSAIEKKVGDVAAGVVERAFSPPHSEQKKDLIDQILNSQFAAGLGAGLGQRGPEMVNSLTANFGKEKVDGWITGAVGKGGGMRSGIPGVSPPGANPGMGGKQQSEMEMVLGLDPNNPEHVAAYANSQGGMSIETARRVLKIHQDDFIKQMQLRSGMGSGNGGGSGGNDIQEDNVQQYRPPPRINDDLIVNTPATEDKRWDREKESKVEVENFETQNIELHPEMEKIEPEKEPILSNIDNSNAGEIATYLKNLNDYVVGLKDDMSSLKQELDILKRDRMIPDDMKEMENKKEMEHKKEDIGNKEEIERKDTTTVRSMKTIKKGFNYVKTDKDI